MLSLFLCPSSLISLLTYLANQPLPGPLPDPLAVPIQVWLVGGVHLLIGLTFQVRRVVPIWGQGEGRSIDFPKLVMQLLRGPLHWSLWLLGLWILPVLFIAGMMRTVRAWPLLLLQLSLLVSVVAITGLLFAVMRRAATSAPGAGMILLLPPMVYVVLVGLIHFLSGAASVGLLLSPTEQRLWFWGIAALSWPVSGYGVNAIALAVILQQGAPTRKAILAQAISQGDLHDLQQQLAHWPISLNRSLVGLQTPLALAVRKQQPEVAKALIQRGATSLKGLNEADCKKMLAWAADLNDPDLLSDLTDLCAQQTYQAALIPAIQQDRIDWVTQLLAPRQIEPTGVIQAVKNNNLKMVEVLLAHGANPNGPDRSSTYATTSLYQAVENQNLDIVRYLLEQGANANSSTPYSHTIIMAAVQNRVDIAQLLLEQGADPNCVEPRYEYGKRTALQQAIIHRNAALITLLLRYGADRTIAATLKAAVATQDITVVQLLLTPHNPALAWQDGLYEAVRVNNRGILQLLLDRTPDLSDAVLALIHAVETNNRELIQLLLSYDLGPEKGAIALIKAVRYNHRDLAEWLLSAASKLNLDINAFWGNMQTTALAQTIESHNLSMAQFLLDRGADPNLNPYGDNCLCTPIQQAFRRAILNRKSLDMVELLVANGADPDGMQRQAIQQKLRVDRSGKRRFHSIEYLQNS